MYISTSIHGHSLILHSMVLFRTADLALSNLAPPESLNAKIDWKQPETSQAVVNTIEEHHLVEISNRGGGNCFFACIAQAVYGHEKHHLQVRREVMSFYTNTMVTGYDNLSMNSKSEIMFGFGLISPAILPSSDFAQIVKEWVHKVGQNGECCSEVDMMTAAFIYRIQIIVLKYSFRQKYMYDDNGQLLMNSQNEIVKKNEGAMGSFIIDALPQNFMNLLSASERQEQSVSAEVAPIMIYNQYRPGIIKDVLSRTPQSKYDEGGHYTLLTTALEKKAPLPSDANQIPLLHDRNSMKRQQGGIRVSPNEHAHVKCDEWLQKNTNNTQNEQRMKIALLIADIARQTKKLSEIDQHRNDRTTLIRTGLENCLQARLKHMTNLTHLEMNLVRSSVLSSENRTNVRDLEKSLVDDAARIEFYKKMPVEDARREKEIRRYLCIKEQQLQEAFK